MLHQYIHSSVATLMLLLLLQCSTPAAYADAVAAYCCITTAIHLLMYHYCFSAIFAAADAAALCYITADADALCYITTDADACCLPTYLQVHHCMLW